MLTEHDKPRNFLQESIKLQSWTLSDERDLDLAAAAPSSCSPLRQSVFPSTPSRSV